MKHIQYQTEGTCSLLIDVVADDNDVIQQVAFLGGCNGNLQGISRLVAGQKIDDVNSPLKRNRLRRQRHFLPRPTLPCSGTTQKMTQNALGPK